MSYNRKQLPKDCRHKASSRAFVRIGGQTYYLGKYGSDASRQEYDRIFAEFVANGRQSFCAPDEVLIENLIARFLDHAEKERSYCDGTKKRITTVLRILNRLYGKAQQILLPYIEKCGDNVEQSVFPRPKAKYCDRWYGNAILTACKKAGVPPWAPNQLRHAHAKTTEIYAKVSFDKAAMVAKEM
jgi:hypothetical protein